SRGTHCRCPKSACSSPTSCGGSYGTRIGSKSRGSTARRSRCPIERCGAGSRTCDLAAFGPGHACLLGMTPRTATEQNVKSTFSLLTLCLYVSIMKVKEHGGGEDNDKA